jgi:arsenate reductase
MCRSPSTALASRDDPGLQGEQAVAIATMYGIRNCDTVKKARAWLDQHGVEYRFHDYKAAGIDVKRLDRWCDEVGWETLMNAAGTTFRRLSASQRETLNRNTALDLMVAQPSVIKRPVLELNGRLIVGFKPDLYKSLRW